MTGTTCPQAVRTRNRRRKKARTYTSKEWKEKVAAFVNGKSCEWCGSTENLLAHHPYRDTPDAIYQDLYLSGCIVLCNTCHFMFHRRRKKKCPVCHENWMDLDVDRCYSCLLKANPGLADVIQVKKAIRDAEAARLKKVRSDKRKVLKAKHPCKFHRVGGKCGRSEIDRRCEFAPTKAMKKCINAIEKKVKA